MTIQHVGLGSGTHVLTTAVQGDVPLYGETICLLLVVKSASSTDWF